MSTFKITNITNHLGKRDHKYNSILNIEYVDNMLKNTIKLKPNDTIFLTLPSLPITAHTLRVKGLITVTEVSGTELANAISNKTLKSETKPKMPEKIEDESSKIIKKRIIKKDDEVI